MTNEIRIGSIIKQVYVKLDPSGFHGPVIQDREVFFVAGDHVRLDGDPILHLKLVQLGVVQKVQKFPDSLQEIRRYGYCRAEDLDSFMEKLLDDMHEALVGYRDNLREMQEHLNGRLSDQVDERISVNWERYRCAAISESSQWVSPFDEGDEIEWSSTQEVMSTNRVEIEDLESGIVLVAKGLEGLSETGIINRMKRVIHHYEVAPKFIIVSEDGFWNNKDGWCLSKEDATRFLDQHVELPIGKGVKVIPETESHTFTDETGNSITE
jgi:hypothetical protein